ncbi:DUF6597 domain-containing transcriptional factor [Paenibacillus lactis]|uniref:DUF6597 domain-containing transcriptional factor n=1 Tax=Paenibacillus lactis TaxID=228574 RepID=UPI003D729BC6
MRSFNPLQAPMIETSHPDASYSYREFLPSPGLSPYVAAYWTLDVRPSARPPQHRILPDGCVDIIFDLHSRSASECAFVAGVMTVPDAFAITEDHCLFGVRFYSETVRLFTRFPVSEFRNTQVFLHEIWGRDAVEFSESIITAAETSQRIERMESYLWNRLNRADFSLDEPILLHGLRYVYEEKGMLSVKSLSEKLHYSERTVRRAFQKELGISPKEMTDIIRFQYLLRELLHARSFRFPDIAAKYGYYDQSHFIHSFKRFYGASPQQVFHAPCSQG